MVVATRAGDGFRGLTATTFIAVSIEPPLVAVALDSLSATREGVLAGRGFSVSVLESGQQFLADRFAGRAPAVDPSWREVPHRLAPGGLPTIDGCAAWFECRVESVVEAGDHDLVIGAVTATGTGGGEPLVLWERSYWRLGR